MTEQQTLVNDTATDATSDNLDNQATATKTYSQQEVDNMMARMKGSMEKKLLKPYAELGDPEELRQIKIEFEKRQQDEAIKRGQFDETLKALAAKKDSEIQKRDSVIKEYKVNTPLLSAAAEFQAVNAEQVKALLANQVRLNTEGEVEVVDSKGAVRYNDKGEALGVRDLVKEFLLGNPHFRVATPSTTNTKSNLSSPGVAGVDVSKLDMKNPTHRKMFADAKAKGKV